MTNLNSIDSLYNLGKTQKATKGQHTQNLRFINQESENAINRSRLRRAFGNSKINGLIIKNITDPYQLYKKNSFPITPFRATFNAGDPLGSGNKAPWKYLQPNGTNQISISKNRSSRDGTHTIDISPSVLNFGDASAYSGNPKFIYDSSDFVKFRKLKAINQNYNDSTFGGGYTHSSSQQAYRRVKH